jgi:hypothetical protein
MVLEAEGFAFFCGLAVAALRSSCSADQGSKIATFSYCCSTLRIDWEKSWAWGLLPGTREDFGVLECEARQMEAMFLSFQLSIPWNAFC